MCLSQGSSGGAACVRFPRPPLRPPLRETVSRGGGVSLCPSALIRIPFRDQIRTLFSRCVGVCGGEEVSACDLLCIISTQIRARCPTRTRGRPRQTATLLLFLSFSHRERALGRLLLSGVMRGGSREPWVTAISCPFTVKRNMCRTCVPSLQRHLGLRNAPPRSRRASEAFVGRGKTRTWNLECVITATAGGLLLAGVCLWCVRVPVEEEVIVRWCFLSPSVKRDDVSGGGGVTSSDVSLRRNKRKNENLCLISSEVFCSGVYSSVRGGGGDIRGENGA